MAQSSPHNLLNTSWTAHRLSPLHHDKEFHSLLDNPVALKTYAARFRDQLAGSALSVAPAAGDEDALSKTGALRDCTWTTIPSLSLLDTDTDTVPSHPAGLSILLEYENTTYKAALLAPIPDTKTTSPKTRTRTTTKSTSTSLPLLLTRLPTPLRTTFLAFLSSSFDTYISPLRLPSSFMASALQIYIDVASSTPDLLEDLVRELQLTLAFSGAVAPALRTLNITVPRSALAGFLGGKDEGEGEGTPVLGRLGDYVKEHLAMELDWGERGEGRYVRLAKVGCGGFVVGGEGRVKLVGPEEGDGDGDEKGRVALRASEALLVAVVGRAVAASAGGADKGV